MPDVGELVLEEMFSLSSKGAPLSNHRWVNIGYEELTGSVVELNGKEVQSLRQLKQQAMPLGRGNWIRDGGRLMADGGGTDLGKFEARVGDEDRMEAM
eukprot:2683906-Pleurochrysis_carterae.AAC.1